MKLFKSCFQKQNHIYILIDSQGTNYKEALKYFEKK
jgi:hypothetical protein